MVKATDSNQCFQMGFYKCFNFAVSFEKQKKSNLVANLVKRICYAFILLEVSHESSLNRKKKLFIFSQFQCVGMCVDLISV